MIGSRYGTLAKRGIAALCFGVLLFAGSFASAQEPAAADADPATERPLAGRNVIFLPPVLTELFGPGQGAVANPAAPSAAGDQANPSGSDGAQSASAASAPLSQNRARRPVVEPVRAIAGRFVPDEVLVTLDGGAGVATEIAQQFGLELRSARVSGLLGQTVARFGIPDGRPVSIVLAQLADEGRLATRAPNHVFELQQAASLVNYAFERIALDAGAVSGEDVSVAVIDTALDPEHPALKDAVAENFDALPDMPVEDRGHGTSISGLIAGRGAFRGVAPGVRLLHARAFEAGVSSADVLLAALDWAVEQGAEIVNMSFVGPENELFDAACANAMARGVVLVAAAGNNGPGAPFGYPAAYDGVIAVTATDAEDRLMEQANRGRYIDLSAPGVDVMAPVPGGMDAVTGTSFAAAVVSGAIANLMHSGKRIEPQALSELLATTAVDLGAPGRDNDFGSGLINARAAMDAR